MIPILDNGHGLDTPGKRSPLWPDGTQLFEWEFNRYLVAGLYQRLKDEGLKPHVLVPEENDVSIRERISRADKVHESNNRNSFLVSLHGNATRSNPRPSGLESFYYSEGGKKLAESIQDELVYILQWKDRGVRKTYQSVKIRQPDGSLKAQIVYKIAITKYTKMRTVLTENGFYSNYEQCTEMLKESVRDKIIDAHLKGIMRYINSL